MVVLKHDMDIQQMLYVVHFVRFGPLSICLTAAVIMLLTADSVLCQFVSLTEPAINNHLLWLHLSVLIIGCST